MIVIDGCGIDFFVGAAIISCTLLCTTSSSSCCCRWNLDFNIDFRPTLRAKTIRTYDGDLSKDKRDQQKGISSSFCRIHTRHTYIGHGEFQIDPKTPQDTHTARPSINVETSLLLSQNISTMYHFFLFTYVPF